MRPSFCLTLILTTLMATPALSQDDGILTRLTSFQRGFTAASTAAQAADCVPRHSTDFETIAAFRDGTVSTMAITQVDLLQQLRDDPDFPSVVVIYASGFSHGADAIVLAGRRTLSSLRTGRVGLNLHGAEHYLYERALLHFFNVVSTDAVLIDIDRTSRAEAVAIDRLDAVVGHFPALQGLVALPGVRTVFDTRELPREIVDLVVMRQDRFRASGAEAQALADAWFARLQDNVAGGNAAGLNGYRNCDQLLGLDRVGLSDREGMHRFLNSGHFQLIMLKAKTFVEGLSYGSTSTEPLGSVGIRMADGLILGDPSQIRIEVAVEHLLSSETP